MFQCSKGHFIRAYLDTIQMTLIGRGQWPALLFLHKHTRKLSKQFQYTNQHCFFVIVFFVEILLFEISLAGWVGIGVLSGFMTKRKKNVRMK